MFAGQILPGADYISDFAWLSRSELRQYLSKDYWNAIHCLLPIEEM